MRLIVACFRDDNYGNKPETWGLDYAVVQLSPEIVTRIQQRCELASTSSEKDRMLCSMRFWERNVAAYRYETLTDALASELGSGFNKFEKQGWTILREDVDLTPFRQEEFDRAWFCAQPAAVRPDVCLKWVMEPTIAGSEEVSTELLSLALFQEALSREAALASSEKKWILDTEELYSCVPESSAF